MNKLGVFVLVAFAALTACRTSKEGYVARGNKLFDAGKYAQAEIEYRNAIRKDAHYGEAYYRLGLVEERLQKPGDAQGALLRAVELLPQDVEPKEQLGSLMLEYYLLDPHHSESYYRVVKQISDELLAKNPRSFEGLREKAYLVSLENRPQEVIDLLRKALEVKPGDPALITFLAQTLLLTGQPAEAEKLATGLIAQNKTYGPVYDVLYKWYSTNRPADAERILKEKVKNNPKQTDYVLELAAYYERQKRPADMKSSLQLLLDDPKSFPQARLIVGDFYARIQDYPEAIHYYEDAARSAANPQEKLDSQKRTVNALLSQRKTSEALQFVDQIIREDPKNDEALRIRANLLLREGSDPNLADAKSEFEDLSKRTPNDPSVWLGLGRTEELKGNLSTARDFYQRAVQNKPDYLPARYALADLGLAQQHPDETLRQADEILKLRRNDARARVLRAEALVATGNSATARAELTNLARDFPKAAEPQLQLGFLAISEKKYQEAEQIFTRLRAAGNSEAAAGLGALYTSQQQYDRALQVLNEGLRSSPDSVQIRTQLVNTATAAGKYPLAVGETRKLLESNPKSLVEWQRLGEIYQLQGDVNSAISAYQEAQKLAPKDLNSGLALANALASVNRVDEAKKQYDLLLQSHPDEPAVLNNYAYLLSQTGGNLDQALSLAQRALQKTPGAASVSDTMGYIYLKKGLRDSAVQVFSGLVRQFPKQAVYHYHLGMALLEKGQKAEAKRELQAALELHPDKKEAVQIRDLLSKAG